MPRTTQGHVGVLVVVDHFSKWLSVIPIRDKRGETIKRAVEERILPSLPYKPIRVLTDNGPEFRSRVLEEILEKYKIEHVLTTPYKPASNGAVERVNRTVIQFLKALSERENKWDKELTRMLLIYNGTYHEEIGMAPNERLVRENNKEVSSAIVPSSEEKWWKEGRAGFVSFIRGQKVLKVIEKKGRLTVDKFRPKYEGPFIVSKVHRNGVTYELEGDDGSILRAHHSQLRQWKDPPNYIKNIDLEAVNVEIDMGQRCRTSEEENLCNIGACGGMGDDWIFEKEEEWLRSIENKQKKEKRRSRETSAENDQSKYNFERERYQVEMLEELRRLERKREMKCLEDKKRRDEDKSFQGLLNIFKELGAYKRRKQESFKMLEDGEQKEELDESLELEAIEYKEMEESVEKSKEKISDGIVITREDQVDWEVASIAQDLGDPMDWEFSAEEEKTEEFSEEEVFKELSERLSSLETSMKTGEEKLEMVQKRRVSLSPCRKKLQEIRQIMEEKRKESRERLVAIRRWPIEALTGTASGLRSGQETLGRVEEVSEDFGGFSDNEVFKEVDIVRKEVINKERDKCNNEEIKSNDDESTSSEENTVISDRGPDVPYTRRMGKVMEIPWVTEEIPGRKRRGRNK